jgi:transcriptional regulator with XRE-family HTH domain
MNTTNDFAVVIKQKLESNPEFARGVRKATFFADISQMVYDARTKAKLSQKDLARMVGTQQSSISRIEDSGYDGHSLSTLYRIAVELNCNLTVNMEPIVKKEQAQQTEDFSIPWNQGTSRTWKIDEITC